MQALDLNQSLYTITAQEIVAYDWAQQIITLTPTLSTRYADTNNEFLQDSTLFILVFNNQRLFGGRIISEISPLVLNYPVMYVMHGTDTLPLMLRPSHRDATTATFPVSDPALAAQVRDYFAQVGKLK